MKSYLSSVVLVGAFFLSSCSSKQEPKVSPNPQAASSKTGPEISVNSNSPSNGATKSIITLSGKVASKVVLECRMQKSDGCIFKIDQRCLVKSSEGETIIKELSDLKVPSVIERPEVFESCKVSSPEKSDIMVQVSLK